MTATASAPTARPDADLLDPAFYLDDPHAAYAWMRANEPLYRDERNGLWAVTRHADVQEVERRSDVFVSGQGYRSFGSPDETNMIALDDPQHAAQRATVARRFTPKAVRQHEAWFTSTIGTLLDGFPLGDDGRGEVEVVDALGAQLPCRLTASLLGWPEDRWPDIKRWSEKLMQYDRITVDNDAALGMLTTIGEFSSELAEMVEARRGCPVHEQDDLVSVWANARLDVDPSAPGAATEYDFTRIIHETGLVISGGAETTRTVITRGLRTFCDHPDQWELLHERPELLPGAVDELVRWVTPLHNFFRTAVTDTTVGGHPVSAGDRFILLYPSANRDEAVFDEPFRFDVTRSPNPHLGFGFGTHFCLGASLARYELGLVFAALVERFTELRVVEEAVDEPNMFAAAVGSFRLGYARR